MATKKSYSIANNHYIFADPRGGSTWLMEIIQQITQEPVIWEPLDLKIRNNPFNAINFDWRQYIPSDAQWLEAKSLFEQLFEGKILQENILDYSSLSQLQNSDSLLFKICRGNALLPWLVEQFQFKHKPILMLRHPIAVASSQIRHGAWGHLVNSFEIPYTPYNSLYLEHADFLKTLSTNEEVLVAKWCLTNSVAIKNSNNQDKWINLFYEDFVKNPENEINRILKVWKLEYDTSKIDFDKNSQTTHSDSPSDNIEKLSHWMTKFSPEQLQKLQSIIDYFEIDLYNIDSPLPLLS